MRVAIINGRSRSNAMELKAGLRMNSCAEAFRNCMHFTIEIDQEDDGRIIAEVLELPGVLAYGQTRGEALARARALALRVLTERLEHGE